MTAKPYGGGGEMKVFWWEWCLRKQEGEYKRWSAWATGRDGRWVSTVALKRQNVACSSDRCSLISAACQHLEWRTVVVFERDPGLVPFWQSQSFSEQYKSGIYIDLTSNHIHRTDLCLKIQHKWADQQKNRSFSSKSLSSSSRDSGARGQRCSPSSPLVIFKPSLFRRALIKARATQRIRTLQNDCVFLLIHHLRLSGC